MAVYPINPISVFIRARVRDRRIDYLGIILSLKKKQYRSEQKKKILALCRDYDSCGAGLQRKRKEIRLARQESGLMQLLKEKGKVSVTQFQEQKTGIQKLKYEEAVLQCEKEKKYIQLEYGLQQLTDSVG